MIELVTTGRQIGTPSTSQLETGTPLGSTIDLDQTPAEVDEEEAAYLRAQDYKSTRILSVTDLKIAGSVLFRIRKENKRWLKLPEPSTDPTKFHYAPDVIKQASVSLIAYRVRCTRTNKSLHTTSFPSQSDYLSEVITYSKDPLPEGTAERLLYSWGQTASLDLCGAWITQGNVQLGCARLILDNCPFAQLRQLLENFISVLLKALKAFKNIIQDYLKEPPKGKGKAKAEEQCSGRLSWITPWH